MQWLRNGGRTRRRGLLDGACKMLENWTVRKSFWRMTAGFCSGSPEPSRCCAFIARRRPNRLWPKSWRQAYNLWNNSGLMVSTKLVGACSGRVEADDLHAERDRL